jgi:hypothetical protein
LLDRANLAAKRYEIAAFANAAYCVNVGPPAGGAMLSCQVGGDGIGRVAVQVASATSAPDSSEEFLPLTAEDHTLSCRNGVFGGTRLQRITSDRGTRKNLAGISDSAPAAVGR